MNSETENKGNINKMASCTYKDNFKLCLLTELLGLQFDVSPKKYEVHNLAPLGNSDHMTISASFSYFPTMSASIPAPKRKLWLYAKADWRALNEIFDKFNWKLCFF